MAAIDEIEEMVDAEMHQEDRDALIAILDALAPLSRESRTKIMSCARMFWGLPRSE